MPAAMKGSPVCEDREMRKSRPNLMFSLCFEVTPVEDADTPAKLSSISLSVKLFERLLKLKLKFLSENNQIGRCCASSWIGSFFSVDSPRTLKGCAATAFLRISGGVFCAGPSAA